MKFTPYIYIVSFLLVVSGCVDTIDVDSQFSEPELVVDAWLTNEPQEQEVFLSYTQDYYDSSSPDVVSGAEVTIASQVDTFVFMDKGNGSYIYNGGQIFGDIGDTLNLRIEYQEEVLVATNVIFRVPEIDSIMIFEEDEEIGIKAGKYAELFATDFEGVGDTYWVRAYKNGMLLNRPQEQTIIYDASFDAGTGLDGITFVRPLRLGINELDDDLAAIPYEEGDIIEVELWSISNSGFRFLQTVVEQSTNGDNAIFTLPIANAQGNIRNLSGDDVLGFFNVSSVSKISKVVE